MFLETGIISGDSSRQYALSVFNIKEQHVGLLNKLCTRWAGSHSTGKLFKALWPVKWNFVQDKEAGFDISIFDLESGTLVIQGYWQSFKYFESHQDVIRAECTFKRSPTGENARMIDEIEAVQSVAVHVRRGDYVTNPTFKEVHGTCSPDYYQRAQKHIVQHVKEPHFFIFTDDPEWVRKRVTFPGPATVVDHNLGNADFEDLRLMTHCKHFIIANSSFSWWGAWLASNQDKIVIAPVKWFRIDSFPCEDRIPREWIML
jgi:hypothetical protein